MQLLGLFVQPASEASGLAIGQNTRFARKAVTKQNTHPHPLAQLGTTLKLVRASFWAVRRSKCVF